MKSIYFILLLTMSGMIALSQDYAKYGADTDHALPKGLKAGSKAPLFSGTNQEGKTITLSENLKKGKVVLIFYRGYWCPFCSRYLQQYQDSLQLIIDKGVSIIAITPEQEEGISKTVEKTNAGFNIISDKGNEIMKDYDVLFNVSSGYNAKIKTMLFTDIAKNNGDEEAKLPVPATYIIGQDGKIEHVQFDPNYKNRASVHEMLKYL